MALVLLPTVPAAARAQAAPSGTVPARPEGPCDIYAAAAAPCVAAHSTTRALYASYDGPLYQILRQSDGRTLDIPVVRPAAARSGEVGGYADAAAQDRFCADTRCWISILYDQSGKGNHLIQPPRGYFGGPAMGGADNLPLADMAPITVMGHKAYGVFIMPGTGLRLNDARGTAVDDQAQGQYWVINGLHYNSGCCFDYGNGETDSRDDGNGTMESTFYGNTHWWYRGRAPGPWIMTDQENNLVGCVNADGSKVCKDLPPITWRFVTAMAKGKPHSWATLGGDSQKGALTVMFDGPRINATYDPMRKQGAIVLGNGGDNSNGSQGTFYEGVMTAAGTYPTDATDQLVQANIVAARYDLPMLALAPASATVKSPGVQTFAPGTTRDVVLTFTNTTGAALSGVRLAVTAPRGWTSQMIAGGASGPVAAGASATATFRVRSGAASFNGDLVGTAALPAAGGRGARTERTVLNVRNAAAIKINEFRVSDGSANPTNGFIELYNAGSTAIDLSNWSVTHRPTREAIFSSIQIPAGTRVKPGGFYLLGQAGSALAVPTDAGASRLHLNSVAGLRVGDTVTVGAGGDAESRKVTDVGSAAGAATTVWQPLPDGPLITIPAGATNVPVTDTSGFAVGDRIAIGHGAVYPTVGRHLERYEVATVTAVGKPGTQAYIAVDVPAGATNVQITSVDNISVGDRIRFDIDSVGHGIDTVVVKRVGTAARRSSVARTADAGATELIVRAFAPEPGGPRINFAAGDTLYVGTPANLETVKIAAAQPDGNNIRLTLGSALKGVHIGTEDVVSPGTGIDIEAPLKFMHAANTPFSARGTGISFTPAARFAHSSNEPVRRLGTGVALDRPLARAHAINAPVQRPANAAAGFQGTADLLFGGPALSPGGGSIVLRDAKGAVADSVNFAGLIDPWAAEGYQAVSGQEQHGCFSQTPGVPFTFEPASRVVANASIGRFPDGRDEDSNCTDFHTSSASMLAVGAVQGAISLAVERTNDFRVGQTVSIGSGVDSETGVITAVGKSGASRTLQASAAGANGIVVVFRPPFRGGDTVTIGTGAAAETVKIADIRNDNGVTNVSFTAPLRNRHEIDEPVVGPGLTLAAPLARAHPPGSGVMTDRPTPGAPNRYAGSQPQK